MVADAPFGVTGGVGRFSIEERCAMQYADGPPRYRIVAAAAHSWASLLLESELGGYALYDLRSGALTPMSGADVGALLADGAYRRWSGTALFTPLEGLPVVGLPSAAPEGSEDPAGAG
jgi:hypothetical protein